MIVKKSYIITVNDIDVEEYAAATDILAETISCSIEHRPHNDGEWFEVIVNCYDYDLWLVESTFAPFV